MALGGDYRRTIACAVWAGLLGVAAPAALAGTGVWTSQGPDGGSIAVIVVDPARPAELYAGTTSGLVKSTDGAATWSAVDGGIGARSVDGLAVDPVTPDTVYVAAGRVFRSDDRGVTFHAADGGLAIEVGPLAIDPAAPQTLYAGGVPGGVFKTLDGGATWAPARTGLPFGDGEEQFVDAIVVDPHTPSIVYAGGDGGVFKSTDGGGTWSSRNEGLPSIGGDLAITASALAIDPVTPDVLYAGTTVGVFKTTDGGDRWVHASEGLTSPYAVVTALAIDPTDPATVYAATTVIVVDDVTYGSGIFKTTNGGDGWSVVSTGLTDLRLQALAIDPATTTTLYAGAQCAGVAKTTDAGALWTAASRSIVNTSVPALAVGPTVFAATSCGAVFRSGDAGASWSGATAGLPPLGTVGGSSLVVDPTTPATVYLGTTGAGVFKSTDGGETWAAMNDGLETDQITALAIDPLTPAVVYAGSSGAGVFKTVDGGLHWQPASVGLPAAGIEALAVDPVTPRTVWAATFGGGVARSLDGAASWAPSSGTLASGLVDLYIAALAIDPSTPSTIYAAPFGGGVFKSVDGGTTWREKSDGLANGNVQHLAVDARRPDTLYAATTTGVFQTVDGAERWAAFDTGLPGRLVFTVAVDGPTVYAGTFGRGVFDFDVEVETTRCSTGTVACALAHSASLTMFDGADDRDDLVHWTWAGVAAVAPGSSRESDVTLCVLDGASETIVRAVARADDSCPRGSCWRGTARRATYEDGELTPDGIKRIGMKARRRGKTRIALKGKGARLRLAPFPIEPPVTVRLERGDGVCWEAIFAVPRRNDRRRFEATLD